MRGFFEISQNKLPKRAFRTMLPTIFTEKASKTIVSCDASSKFHRTSFQNERFARCFRQFSQKKLPKRSFRAMLPPNFIEQSFQKDRFVRGLLQISQNKLPKRAFRTMLPPNFTEQASKTNVSCEASAKFHRRKASKMIVSCEASSKFHRTSFQNERFAQGFRQFSQKKLPKRSFRAMLLRNFTEQASKTSVSHDASHNFHRKSFQNDRFVRCFFEIRTMLPTIFTEEASKTIVSCDASSKFHRTKLPKRSFRARPPPNFTEQASKTNVSHDASSIFHRTKLPKRAFRARLLPNLTEEKLPK